MKQTAFGFLPKTINCSTELFSISTISDWEKDYKLLENESAIDDGWCYPAIIYKNQKPLKAQNWFSLPVSHSMKLSTDISEFELQLLVLVFGFLNGLHLLPESWGHYYKTPIKIGRLVGFILSETEIFKIMDQVIRKIMSKQFACLKSIFASLNWFLLSQSYSNYFEEFESQYRVIDSICKNVIELQKKEKMPPHYQRIQKVCQVFNVTVPQWAIPHEGKTEISSLRNELIHEGFFCGEPIGFNFPENNIVLELKTLNERLLLLCLGIDSDEIKNDISNIRSIYSLSNIRYI